MGCPLAGVGTGFVLGGGDPKTAKLAVQFEAPGKDEVIADVTDVEELRRRRERYPELEEQFIKRGIPVVGKAGGIFWGWGLAAIQYTRRDIFVDNTLRCLPPKQGNSQYPKGAVRKRAEACCRVYDRWEEYNPTVALINIHPAAIAREPTPLVLQIKTFERAKDFVEQSERPLVLCGGKATGAWLGYGENVTKWCGSHQKETQKVKELREGRRVKGMEMSTEKKKPKKKKLTAKTALLNLLTQFEKSEDGTCWVPREDIYLNEEQFNEMLVLAQSKPKVKKEKENE